MAQNLMDVKTNLDYDCPDFLKKKLKPRQNKRYLKKKEYLLKQEQKLAEKGQLTGQSRDDPSSDCLSGDGEKSVGYEGRLTKFLEQLQVERYASLSMMQGGNPSFTEAKEALQLFFSEKT